MVVSDRSYRVLELLALRPKGWRRLEISTALEIPRCYVDDSLSELKSDGFVVVRPESLGKMGRPTNQYYCTLDGVKALNAAFRRSK